MLWKVCVCVLGGGVGWRVYKIFRHLMILHPCLQYTDHFHDTNNLYNSISIIYGIFVFIIRSYTYYKLELSFWLKLIQNLNKNIYIVLSSNFLDQSGVIDTYIPQQKLTYIAKQETKHHKGFVDSRSNSASLYPLNFQPR